jgi:hypothetical protein
MTDADRLRADAALVDIGVWARSKTIVDSHGEAAGGIICAILEGPGYDTETGEITNAVAYRTRDPDDLDRFRIRILGAGDIDPAACHPASARDVGRLVRRLCFEIGRSKNRTGIAREIGYQEQMALHDILVLLRAVS